MKKEDLLAKIRANIHTTYDMPSFDQMKGVKYDDLSPQEKQQLETAWAYEKAKLALDPRSEYARDIDAKEIFQVFYNQDTIDKVLEDLMENGLRVNDGDTIGKTIIFAYRHKHAEMIVERFNALYPQYGPDFCTLIDNQVKYGQDLIDNFSAAPQDQKRKIKIAVRSRRRFVKSCLQEVAEAIR